MNRRHLLLIFVTNVPIVQSCRMGGVTPLYLLTLIYLMFFTSSLFANSKDHHMDVQYLLDERGVFNLADVEYRQGWEEQVDTPIRFTPGSTAWFRMTVTIDAPQTFFIEHRWNMPLGQALLYYRGQAIQPLRKHASLFTISLASGTHTMFIRLSNLKGRWLKAKLSVEPVQDYELRQQNPFNSAYLFYGAPLSMVVLAVAMAISVRRRYLVYYVIYILSLLCVLAIGAFHLPNLYPALWQSLLVVNAVVTVLFMQDFLPLKQVTPKLNKSLFLLAATFSLLSIIEDTQDRELFTYIPQILIYVLSAVAAGICAFQRVPNAGILFAGWTILALSFILNSIGLRLGWNGGYLLSVYSGFAIETILFTLALVLDTRKKETLAQEQNEHALKQLAKVFYPHQINSIRQGKSLEDTMPTGDGEAAVLVFDVVGSSKIQHERVKQFFEGIFRRCNSLMNQHYNGDELIANAYRIKEMGDGFICSVGFPFQHIGDSKAEAALALALNFHQAFLEEVALFNYHEPLACCIGIAMDHVSGYFPATGTKSYDLFGKGIILATRYESMRKSFDKVKALNGQTDESMIIVQEKVYASLPADERAKFIGVDLAAEKLVVRDDPQARKIFVRLLKGERIMSLQQAS